ncbi:MAG: hypothetical protein IKM74_01695 [Bacteroidales bacterium]|nr:hypothetical protein [Bacteroidales bacterium]
MMKRLLLVVLLSMLIDSMSAQTSDSLTFLQHQISAFELQLRSIEQRDETFNVQLKELKSQVARLSDENSSLDDALRQKQESFDSLARIVANNSANIKTTADELGVKIQTTDKAVSNNANSIRTKTIWGAVAFMLALLASAMVWLLHMRAQKTSDDKIALLKNQADELNEKIVGQFSDEMSELQKLSDVLRNAGGNALTEPDHSLVKTLADRITFMEMTLYRMDSSVKGHKQLSKSIAQMKDNLLANGYEIVDMLGKEYDEGMKVTANFNEDENIEAGKQIITGIVKPQINYKGIMIQSAQITVSQN